MLIIMLVYQRVTGKSSISRPFSIDMYASSDGVDGEECWLLAKHKRYQNKEFTENYLLKCVIIYIYVCIYICTYVYYIYTQQVVRNCTV